MKKALAGLLILLGLVSCTGDSNRLTTGEVVFESKDKKVKVFKEEVDFVINQSMDPEMLDQVPKEQLDAQKKAIIKQLQPEEIQVVRLEEEHFQKKLGISDERFEQIKRELM